MCEEGIDHPVVVYFHLIIFVSFQDVSHPRKPIRKVIESLYSDFV